jgi:hypothetical protein
MNEPRVRIHYKQRGAPGWQEFPITIEEYYEPDDDGLEWDSTPRHVHADEYLAIGSSELEQTVLELYDQNDSLRSTVTETLWNNGHNRLIERVEGSARLLIMQVLVQEEPPTFHTIRLDRTRKGRTLLEHFVDAEGWDDRHETIVSYDFKDR